MADRSGACAVPRFFNAADDLIRPNLEAGRADKVAIRDDAGSYTYAELAERVDRCANALRAMGLEPEQRVVLCLLDSVDFPTAFLGAIKAGLIPVPVNTLLTRGDYDYMLADSRARALIVSERLLPQFEGARDRHPSLRHVVVSGTQGHDGLQRLSDLLAAAPRAAETAPTTRDDMCFWLYSSGSTGAPKGTVHLHASMRGTAELFGRHVLGIREDDTVYSAAKLFFAYGLGNALTFPLSVGATAVLTAERPTPALVSRILRDEAPTIFYGVPTLYGALLSHPDLPPADELALRLCTSAGEPLPPDLGRRWARHTGVEILDGLGSTEMLNTFLSNRPGEVRLGTTGRPVPGYRIRLVDEAGADVPQGEIGELYVEGPTSAAFYWNNRELSRRTFLGPWTRSGDRYRETQDGYYVFCGRADDMLKVGGVFVSPFEVEGALLTHAFVQEVAVVGQADEHGLVKPKAYVVLKPGVPAGEETVRLLQRHVKDSLAPYKYPRWIDFLPELPRTATGKVQRFKLRREVRDAEPVAG
jgi:benzoate-CoA ligase